MRKWVEDSGMPAAEGHADRMLAADVPFLYYSRLRSSMATVCCNKGM